MVQNAVKFVARVFTRVKACEVTMSSAAIWDGT
jgi:hypothetical protein